MKQLRDIQRRARRTVKQGPKPKNESGIKEVAAGFCVSPSGNVRKHEGHGKDDVAGCVGFHFHMGQRVLSTDRKDLAQCLELAATKPEKLESLAAIFRMCVRRGIEGAIRFVLRSLGVKQVSAFLALIQPHREAIEAARTASLEYDRRDRFRRRRDRYRITRQRMREIAGEAAERAEQEKKRAEEQSEETSAPEKAKVTRREGKKEEVLNESGVFGGLESTVRRVVTVDGRSIDLEVHDGGKSLAQRIEEDGFLNRRGP